MKREWQTQIWGGMAHPYEVRREGERLELLRINEPDALPAVLLRVDIETTLNDAGATTIARLMLGASGLATD